MKLAKTFAILMAVLGMVFCLVSSAGAQEKPAKKHAGKGKAGAKAAAAAPAPKPSEGGATEAPKLEPIVAKRDPFEPLVNEKEGARGPLPPGKAGLVISTIRWHGASALGHDRSGFQSGPARVFHPRGRPSL
jgi:hypothetical protein